MDLLAGRSYRSLEAYVPVILAVLGAASLLVSGGSPAVGFGAAALMAAVGVTALPPLRDRVPLCVRAWTVLALSVAIPATGGGLESTARILPVIAATTYPLWLPQRQALAYPAVAATGYLLLFVTTPGGVVRDFVLWAVVSLVVGSVVTRLGMAISNLAADRESVQADARSAHARFEAAFESARTGMAIVARDGTLLSTNRALADFLATPRLALEGANICDAVVAEDREWLVESLRAMPVSNRDGFTRELQLVDQSGNTVWGVVVGSAIGSSGSPADPLFLQIHDVTAQVSAARELRESELHYRHLFGGSPVPTLEVDFSDAVEWVAAIARRGVADVRTYLADRPAKVREGAALIRIEDANTAAVELLELDDRASLLGPLSTPDLIDESLSGLTEQLISIWEGRAVASATVRARSHRGGQIDGMLQWVVPSQDGISRFDRVIVSIVDLTAFRRAQERLEKVQNRLRTVVGAAPIVLFAVDRFGVFTLAEGQGLNRLGIAPGEPVGRSVFEMFRDSPQLVRAVRRATSGEAFTTSVEIRSFHFDVRFTPIWEAGRVSGVIGVANDVTERQQATARLEALVRTKDEFVAGVSHELRTPLTAVVGFATELRDNLESLAHEDVRAYIDLIASQAMDVGDLVEDLLVAARVDMDKVAVFPEPISVNDQVEGVLAGWPDDNLVRVERQGPPAKALADPIRVRQILRNLLTNAQRYGGPQIRVAVEQDSEHVRIRICDNGLGIPETERDQVFEPYHRAHATHGQPLSVGLGLTVSRQLARLMAGDLDYRYEDGWSVFTLTLPAVG